MKRALKYVAKAFLPIFFACSSLFIFSYYMAQILIKFNIGNQTASIGDIEDQKRPDMESVVTASQDAQQILEDEAFESISEEITDNTETISIPYYVEPVYQTDTYPYATATPGSEPIPQMGTINPNDTEQNHYESDANTRETYASNEEYVSLSEFNSFKDIFDRQLERAFENTGDSDTSSVDELAESLELVELNVLDLKDEIADLDINIDSKWSEEATSIHYNLGSVGIGTTTPWRSLSITGTVGIEGLSSSPIGNALCINENNEITSATSITCLGVSSLRFKNTVATSSLGLETIIDLRPVSFRYNDGVADDGQSIQYGFIAEEAYMVDQNLAILDTTGQPITVRYDFIAPILTKAVQELNIKVETLEAIAFGEESEDTISIIESIARRILDLLKDSSDWVFEKISAGLAVFDRVETDIAAISTGLEILDTNTGDVWCVQIKDGDWDKEEGACEEEEEEEEEDVEENDEVDEEDEVEEEDEVDEEDDVEVEEEEEKEEDAVEENNTNEENVDNTSMNNATTLNESNTNIADDATDTKDAVDDSNLGGI